MSARARPPREPWLLGRALGAAWRGLRAGCAEVGGVGWRRYAAVLAAGFAATCTLTWGMTAAARALLGRGLQDWDERALRAVAAGPLSFSDAIVLESPANLAYLVPLVLALAALLAARRRALEALSLVLVYAGLRPLIFLGWGLWDRPRPELVAEGIASPPLHSFPSGHAALALATYGFLAFLWARRARRRGERALALAAAATCTAAICWARLRLGTHWPSDVVAGLLQGGAWLASVVLALRAAERAPRRAGAPRAAPQPVRMRR